MTTTIFDKIVSGEMKAWKVWEDDDFLAFLTPFPNAPGLTVLIPKINQGDYLFSLQPSIYTGLLMAARTVAKKLEEAFQTPRVAMIVEGTGVAHVHIKLLPLIGELAEKTDVWSQHKEFNELYQGYISSAEGPKMDDARLDEIAERIRSQT